MSKISREQKHIHLRKYCLKYNLYLVVVGVETLDEVDADDDVDAELEVEALIRK